MKGVFDIADMAKVLLACTLIVLVVDVAVPLFFRR